ncbi:MAG: serine hydrolase, partial [Sulfitobacter sp.]|nr:serine hydrolase [Sulfitobacter sp.]
MTELQNLLNRAVAAQDLPFAVAMVATGDQIVFEGAAGDAARGRPADLDTTFRIFSMTKGVGALAAMI